MTSQERMPSFHFYYNSLLEKNRYYVNCFRGNPRSLLQKLHIPSRSSHPSRLLFKCFDTNCARLLNHATMLKQSTLQHICSRKFLLLSKILATKYRWVMVVTKNEASQRSTLDLRKCVGQKITSLMHQKACFRPKDYSARPNLQRYFLVWASW